MTSTSLGRFEVATFYELTIETPTTWQTLFDPSYPLELGGGEDISLVGSQITVSSSGPINFTLGFIHDPTVLTDFEIGLSVNGGDPIVMYNPPDSCTWTLNYNATNGDNFDLMIRSPQTLTVEIHGFEMFVIAQEIPY